MEIDKYIYGIIVFVAFISVGLMIFYGNGVNNGIVQDYELDLNSNKFGNISKNLEKITNLTQEQRGIMESLEGAEGVGALEKLFSGAYAAVRLIPRFASFAASSMGSIIHEIQLPPIFIIIGAGAMLTSLVWAMIYLIFRFQPR